MSTMPLDPTEADLREHALNWSDATLAASLGNGIKDLQYFGRKLEIALNSGRKASVQHRLGYEEAARVVRVYRAISKERKAAKSQPVG